MLPKVLLGAAAVALSVSVSVSGCGGNGHASSGPGPGPGTVDPSTATTGIAGAVTTVPPASPATTTVAPAASSSTTATHGSGSATTTAAGTAQTVTATSGGLVVKLTITPVRGRVGAPVSFTMTAQASHAVGALGYVLSYGDGGSDQNAVPDFCVAGTATASQASWSLTHAYSTAGNYAASVRVHVNCGGDHLTTAPVTLAIS